MCIYHKEWIANIEKMRSLLDSQHMLHSFFNRLKKSFNFQTKISVNKYYFVGEVTISTFLRRYCGRFWPKRRCMAARPKLILCSTLTAAATASERWFQQGLLEVLLLLAVAAAVSERVKVKRSFNFGLWAASLQRRPGSN